jgi:hypothetical protein
MRALPPNSDLLSLHRTCDVVGLSNGKRDNRECRVARGTSDELASVGDEYVVSWGEVFYATFANPRIADSLKKLLGYD